MVTSRAIREVISKYSVRPRPSVPPNNQKSAYGRIQLQKTAFLFDLADNIDVVESENPLSMESVDQMFGFILYLSEFKAKEDGIMLSIPKVHDRAQVFVSCLSVGDRPTYVGTITRWSNRPLNFSYTCDSNIRLYILVENMGRVNYGAYLFDRKGILSLVYLDSNPLHSWKMLSFPLHNLHKVQDNNPIVTSVPSDLIKVTAHGVVKRNDKYSSKEPAFYSGRFHVNEIKDTFLSFHGWGKGVVIVNDFNIGRYWPSAGPQCSLYVPAPILQLGENVLVLLELESPHPGLVIRSINHPDFTCGSRTKKVNQF